MTIVDDERVVALARRPGRGGGFGKRGGGGKRYVRTPEGSNKYGLPIGSLITRDAELRAKAKGRNYNVPEDGGGDFGSQPPDAGKTRRDPAELVTAIRNAPTPKTATPEGPKKVAVGNAGYSFPDGSRTFRPKDHDNIAIVRTPDYQLVAVSDKGVAIELEGDLEKELNDELDGDLSEHYTTDEPPTPEQEQDAADRAAQDADEANGVVPEPEAPPVPDSPEQMPGYLSDKHIDDIIAGMEASGLDQNTLNAAELSLHQNNKRIRKEHADAKAKQDTAAAKPDTTPEEESTEPAPPLPPEKKPGEPYPPAAKPDEKPAEKPDLRTRPDGVNTLRPEDQKKIDDKKYDDEKPSTTSRKDGKVGQHADNIQRREREQSAASADDEATAKPAAKPSGNRRANATRRPSQREEVGDTGLTPDEIGQARELSDQERAAKAPKQETPAESEQKLKSLEELATARSSGVAEGTVSGNKVSLRRNRVNGAVEFSIENDDGTTETFTDRKELLDTAAKKGTQAKAAKTAPKPKRNQVVTLPGGERALVLGDDDNGNVRLHVGNRGPASLPAEDLKVVRSHDSSGQGKELSDQLDAMGDSPTDAELDDMDIAVQDFLDNEDDDDVAEEDTSAPEDMTTLSDAELAAVRSNGSASMARRVAARKEESRRKTGTQAAPATTRQATPQDTAETPASDLSDAELNSLLSDLDDFHSASAGTAQSRARRAEVYKEWTERNPPPPLPGAAPAPVTEDSELASIKKPAYWDQMSSAQKSKWEARQRRAIARRNQPEQAAPDSAEAADTDTLSTDVRGPNAKPMDAAERKRLGIAAGKGEFSQRVSGRDQILNAKEGDKFVSRGAGGRAEQVWEVRDDGDMHNLTRPGVSMSRDEFADLDTGVAGSPEVYAFSGNDSNNNDALDLQSGDTATRSWADDALPGAASYSDDDGLRQEKNLDGTVSTPIGDLEPEDFDASDVESTDSRVVRTESDGRPVGATNQLRTAEDLKDVKSGDGVAIAMEDGTQIDGRRLDDGSVELDVDGLKAVIPADDIVNVPTPVWHVPNRDLTGKPTKKKWSVGDTLKNLDDLLAQKVGTRLRYKYKKPIKGKNESEYTVLPDGEVKSEIGTVLPSSRLKGAVEGGQVSVLDVPPDNAPEPDPTPREITNPDDYVDGDRITDYRHLKDMKPGEQVTLVVPAHKNGGQEAQVVLTRTDDNKVMGGYMFSIGRRGRGYNSFGENNASVFQAIHDGRLYSGDITRPEDNLLDPTVEGAWDKTASIELWQGGPKVSEHDLQSFIASQVYSPAMQTGYYDQGRLPLNNPFRNKQFRNEFSKRAMKEFNQPNNPMRDKPAAIRYAAQHLGLRYDDPGSTLIPDDLDFADFKKKVDVGASWYPSGIPAEGPTMGDEKIEVTVADVKTALAVLDNMLESDDINDADKILKRVFARQGSPLQNMNTSVAVAAYFQIKRHHHKDGSISTKPARSDDKRKNAELMRQMLREQAEGREPGYYGVPADDTFTITHKGNKYVGTKATHKSGLTRPALNSDNDPDPNAPKPGSPMDSQTPPPAAPSAPANAPEAPTPEIPETNAPEANAPEANAPEANVPEAPAAPVTRNGRAFDDMTDQEVLDYADELGEEANLRRQASDPLDETEQADLDEARAQARDRTANPRDDSVAPTRPPAAAPEANTPEEAVPEAPAAPEEEAPEAPPADVATGEKATSSGDFALLAPGQRVRNPDTGSVYEKQDDETWRVDGQPDLVITPDLMEQSANFSDGYEVLGDGNDNNVNAPAQPIDSDAPEFNPPDDVDDTNTDTDQPTLPGLSADETAALAPPKETPLERLRRKNPHKLFIEDANGNITNPATHRRIKGTWERSYVYDHTTDWNDRRDVFELDNSETQTYVDVAAQHGLTVDPADLQGKRLFITEDGDAVGWLDGDEIGGVAHDQNSTHALENLMPTLVGRGGRVAITEDNPDLSKRLSATGFRAQAFVNNPGGGRAQISYSLDPDYIGSAPVAPSFQMPFKQKDDALRDARAAFVDYEKHDFHMAADKGKAGDGHVIDASGKKTKLWGKYGASGLLMRHTDASSGEERFLLVQRAGNPKSPIHHKWQLPGGGLDEKETDHQGAARETVEETAPPPEFLSGLKAVGEHRTDDVATGWHYSNLTADTPDQYTPVLNTHELSDHKWLTRAEISQMEADGELHPALADSIRDSLATFGGTPANALPAPARPRPLVTPAQAAAPKRGSINDPGARATGFAGGSQGGKEYEVPDADGNLQRFFVKPAPDPDRGKQEALASDLYRLAGAGAPEVEYDAKDRKIYSLMTPTGRVPANAKDVAKEDFVADAWVANWDVRLGDNLVFSPSGKAIRLDNGGALEYRSKITSGKKSTMGMASTFDDTVTELDTLRTPLAGDAYQIWGGRSGGKTDAWEIPSAQKVVDVPDADIRAMVKKHDLPDTLADTLIARREYIAKHYGLKPVDRAPLAPPVAPAPAEAPTTTPQAPEVLAALPAAAPQAPKVDRAEGISGGGATKYETPVAGAAPVAGDHYSIPMADGTTKDFAVITPKTAEQGKAIDIASSFYDELGVGSIQSEYDATDNNVYSELQQVTVGPADLKPGFLADAWLGNRSAATRGRFGTDADGNAVRIDNRGALGFHTNGTARPDFGNDVVELTSLRDPATNGSGANAYGQQSGGKVDAFEIDGAQQIVDLSDDRITDIVAAGGGDNTLADKLIKRRNYIAKFYGLRASNDPKPGLANPRRFTDVNEAPSLSDAKRLSPNTQPDYVRAFLPQGTTYNEYLKTTGGFNKAFEKLWRANNPDKPDAIKGGKVTGKALLNSGASDDDIIDLAATFDFSPGLFAAKAQEMGSTISDDRVLHEVIAEQRGFHDTNSTVSVDELDKLISSSSEVQHMFRTVNAWGGHTGIQAADLYKTDDYWRRGNGAKAHGEGIYMAVDLNGSMGYGTTRAGVMEAAYDKRGWNAIGSDQMRTWQNPRMKQIVQRVRARNDLDKETKDALIRGFSEQGTAAVLMGYDALYGNAGTGDLNVLNKGRVTFSTSASITKQDVLTHSPPAGWNQPRISDTQRYRNAQAALQPGLRQSNAAQGNTPATTPAQQAAGVNTLGGASRFPVGSVMTNSNINQMNIGSVVDTVHNGQAIQLRRVARGWDNVATRRNASWMNNLAPRGRNRFTVVVST